MNRFSVRVMVLAIFLVGLTACASTTTREYSGPELPADQTALVESGPYTEIEVVDGRAVGALKVAVLPGTHSVALRPSEHGQPIRDYWFYSRSTGSVSFNAEAGHRYLVYVDFVPDEGPADEQKGSGYVWIGYVLDRATGKKIANTGKLPVGVEPRIWPGGTLPFDRRVMNR